MNLNAKIPHLLKEDTARKYDAFLAVVKDAGVSLPDDSEFINALKRVFTFSDFVFKNCTRDPEFFKDLNESGDLQRTFGAGEFREKLISYLIDVKDEVQLSRQLRRFRRYHMVRIAWRDLAGWANLSETMDDVSALADACIDQAVFFLYQWQCLKYGIPTARDGSHQRVVVFGMGKLGGQELNFSSDVDLIFAYPKNGITQAGLESINNVN
jgi:glutamate-ammonia-ligase adenylyltransferase